VHRDAGGVDLGEAGIGEKGTFFIGPVGGGHVGGHGVGGQEKDIAVAAGAKHHGVGGVALHLTVDHVANDDAPGVPVDQHHIQHLAAGEHFDLAGPTWRIRAL
jgi:hypothetical protein